MELNSRVTILFSDEGLNIKRVDMDIIETIDVLQRLLLHFRMVQGGMGSTNYLESLEVHPDELVEKSKVCVAWNPDIRKMQVALTGINEFHACHIIEYAVSYLQKILIMGE